MRVMQFSFQSGHCPFMCKSLKGKKNKLALEMYDLFHKIYQFKALPIIKYSMQKLQMGICISNVDEN